MYIAQDHTLTPTEQRFFNLYLATYPTDQTKFNAHIRLSANKDRNEQTIRQLCHDVAIYRSALQKISQQAGKTRKGQLLDHTWCQQIAQDALKPTNAQEE
jgi:hypothetical protein